MRRFECVDGTSSKFWEVAVEGTMLHVRYGRIGTPGQAKDKDCASATAALAEADQLIREKAGKGYAEVTVTTAWTRELATPVPTTAPALSTVSPVLSATPEAQPSGNFLWTATRRKALLPWRGEDVAAPPRLEREAVIADYTQRLAISLNSERALRRGSTRVGQRHPSAPELRARRVDRRSEE